MLKLWKKTPKKNAYEQQLQQLIDCRNNLELREEFLQHKLSDIFMLVSKRQKQKHVAVHLLKQSKQLQGIIENTFYAKTMVDGLIDSTVSVGVIQETERLLSASTAVSVAEDLMGCLSNSIADVNDMCAVLSENICDVDDKELLAELDNIPMPPPNIDLTVKEIDLPQPPTTTITRHDRRNIAATA